MIRFRRTSPEPRLEMTPLLDVVFLLLTFFLFSQVLMAPVRVLDIRLPGLGAAERPAERDIVTIGLAEDGAVLLDGEPVAEDRLVDELRSLTRERPDARLFIAADTEGRSGDLLRLVDRLTGAGFENVGIVGRGDSDAPANAD